MFAHGREDPSNMCTVSTRARLTNITGTRCVCSSARSTYEATLVDITQHMLLRKCDATCCHMFSVSAALCASEGHMYTMASFSAPFRPSCFGFFERDKINVPDFSCVTVTCRALFCAVCMVWRGVAWCDVVFFSCLCPCLFLCRSLVFSLLYHLVPFFFTLSLSLSLRLSLCFSLNFFLSLFWRGLHASRITRRSFAIRGGSAKVGEWQNAYCGKQTRNGKPKAGGSRSEEKETMNIYSVV